MSGSRVARRHGGSAAANVTAPSRNRYGVETASAVEWSAGTADGDRIALTPSQAGKAIVDRGPDRASQDATVPLPAVPTVL